MKTVMLPGAERAPALGISMSMGSWMIGERRARRSDEVAALRAGLDIGLRLVDGAEMYGDGKSERLIGEVIRGQREEVFLVARSIPSMPHLALAWLLRHDDCTVIPKASKPPQRPRRSKCFEARNKDTP